MLISAFNYSKDEFTSNVENSPNPVFLFVASLFRPDFTIEIHRFAGAHPHLKIYGLSRKDFEKPEEYDKIIQSLGVGGASGFVLWKDGKKILGLSEREFSNLNTVLGTMGLLKTSGL